MTSIQNDIAVNVSAEKSFFSPFFPFYPLHLAFFSLLYVFLPSFVLSAFLLLRVGSPVSAYWCSQVLWIGAAFYWRREISWREGIVFLCLLVAAHLVSYYFFDFFHDSLAYFQPAIRRIADGFNPVYDGYIDFGRAPDLWSDQATYFPKSSMYFAACLAAALGDIQLGKAYQVLLLFSALFYAAHVTRGESLLKKCLWFAACLNPIVLIQWTSFVVDSALASLSLIGLLFANAFFTKKSLSSPEYALGVMALSLLFCVKTTGFAYGSIIIFFICLRRLYSAYQEAERPRRLRVALKRSCSLGLRLGGLALLTVCVVGFHPYITNLREGRHIFYPLVQAPASTEMRTAWAVEYTAQRIYPFAHNRFTRVLVSIFSHPDSGFLPARLKNLLSAPLPDWLEFENTASLNAGGLGPFFGLLLCVAVLMQLLLRGGGNVWLLLTLFVMTFIQPHAWVLRYAPFVWLVPFVCVASIPRKKEMFLIIPLLVAFINIGGVLFFFCRFQWALNQWMRELFVSRQGEIIFLDRTIFELDGILNRFDLRRKYVNPEEVIFSRDPDIGHLARNRTSTGVNFFFPEDLPPLPEYSMSLSSEASLPWLRMSEGLVPTEEYREGSPVIIWRSYSNRIKFFMRADGKPTRDWRVTLRGRPYGLQGIRADLTVVAFVNDRPIGTWLLGPSKDGERSFVIPRALMEEAFEDDGRLLTFMLRIPAVSSKVVSAFMTSPFGLELEGIEFQPCDGNSSEAGEPLSVQEDIMSAEN
jgi:hypothetical protein